MMLSKSALNRVGKRLRDAETPNPEDVAAYADYQAEFREPVERVFVDLFESMEDLDALSLSARLKKLESVIAKLRRHPTRLSTIDDIGGVRMVVPTLRELAAVESEMTGFSIVKRRDYSIEAQGGYRAIHLIIEADPRHRIELQIRTQLQNQWANLSEKLFQKVDSEVKYGGGPDRLRTQLDRLSEEVSLLDALRSVHGEIEDLGLHLRQMYDLAAVEELGWEDVDPSVRPEALAKMDEMATSRRRLYHSLTQFRQRVERIGEWSEGE